jgi:hypothetical protein
MVAPKGPEQLHMMPTLIGAPVAWALPAGADDALLLDWLPVDWLLVDWLAVVGLLEVFLLLDEHAAAVSASVNAATPHRPLRSEII